MCRIAGRQRKWLVRAAGVNGEIPVLKNRNSNICPVNPGDGHCQTGSLTGAVSSQKVTEESKASLIVVGNHELSVKVQERLTASPTRQADTKVGLSEPAVESGIAVA